MPGSEIPDGRAPEGAGMKTEFNDLYFGEWDGRGTQLAEGLHEKLSETMRDYVLGNLSEFIAAR